MPRGYYIIVLKYVILLDSEGVTQLSNEEGKPCYVETLLKIQDPILTSSYMPLVPHAYFDSLVFQTNHNDRLEKRLGAVDNMPHVT